MLKQRLETRRGKPVFALVSLLCVVLALPLAKLVIAIIPRKEDLLGYGAVGIALLVIIGCLVLGIVLGLVGWFRKEKPRALCAVALAANSLPLFWLLYTLPFIVGNT